MNKLKYKVGNLVQAAESEEINVIAHCCNCFNTMGSGVALALRKSFPGIYNVDCKTQKGDKDKLGNFTVWERKEPSLAVFNLYGQYYYGQKNGPQIQYDKLEESMERMGKILTVVDTLQEVKIGLPLIGCGLAGGDWIRVKEIIDKTLIKRDLDVTVYVLSEEQLKEVTSV